MLTELSAIVTGDVQGVGFRATVKAAADELKLKGFVRNLDNGCVEICAQGKEEDLEVFLARLHIDFPCEYIVEYRHPTQAFYDFKITR